MCFLTDLLFLLLNFKFIKKHDCKSLSISKMYLGSFSFTLSSFKIIEDFIQPIGHNGLILLFIKLSINEAIECDRLILE